MLKGTRWFGSRAHDITVSNLFDASAFMRLARCFTPSCVVDVVEGGSDDAADAKLGVVDRSCRSVEDVVGMTAIRFDVEATMSDVVGLKVVGCVEVMGVVEGVEVDSVVAAGVDVVSFVEVVGAVVLGSGVLGAAVLGSGVLGAAVLGAAVLGAAVLATVVLGALSCTGRSLDSGQFAGAMPIRPAAVSKMMSLWRIQEAPRTVSAPAPSSSKA